MFPDLADILPQIIPVLVGAFTGGGVIAFTKSGRAKAKADGYKAMSEAYEYRIHSMEESMSTANETIARQRDTIAKTDADLDAKTLQIRSLTQKLWDAEQEVNRVNERNHTQAERIARLMLEVEHWKHWHCRRCDCQDPRGREPSQDPPESVYTPYQQPEI